MTARRPAFDLSRQSRSAEARAPASR
jgi:hypothetical protein